VGGVPYYDRAVKIKDSTLGAVVVVVVTDERDYPTVSPGTITGCWLAHITSGRPVRVGVRDKICWVCGTRFDGSDIE
jgi:hypothetical protein